MNLLSVRALAADQPDRYPAIDAAVVVGLEHDAHAVLADDAEQLVAAVDDATDIFVEETSSVDEDAALLAISLLFSEAFAGRLFGSGGHSSTDSGVGRLGRHATIGARRRPRYSRLRRNLARRSERGRRHSGAVEAGRTGVGQGCSGRP